MYAKNTKDRVDRFYTIGCRRGEEAFAMVCARAESWWGRDGRRGAVLCTACIHKSNPLATAATGELLIDNAWPGSRI